MPLAAIQHTPAYPWPGPPTLAAAQYSFVEVLVLLMIIFGLGIVLAVVSVILRRKLMSQDTPPPIGFTLKDLRELHARGELSDEELERAQKRTKAQSRSLYLGDEDEEVQVKDVGDITDADGGPNNAQS